MRNETRSTEQHGWQIRFGFFAGPVLWGLQLLVGYGLAAVSCNLGDKRPEYILLGISVLIVLAAAIVVDGAWRRSPGYPGSIFTGPVHSHDALTFLAVSSFIVSLLLFLLIVATLAVDILSSPCPIITMPLP